MRALFMFSVTFLATCRTEFTPVTFVYYSDKRNWKNANYTCARVGATLAHFSDISSIMDILEDLPQIKNITVWNDDTSKRYFKDEETLNLCGAITLNANRTSSQYNCLQELPFLCQYQTGQCQYRIYEQTSIRGNNIFTKTAITWQHCHDLCETVTEFICRSFEYNPVSQYCQLSETNRWQKANQFAFNVRSWDYYHKTCITALLKSNFLEYSSTLSILSTMPSTSSTVSIVSTTQKIPVASQVLQPLRVLMFENPLSWSKANEFCKSKGGTLAVLNDKSIIPEANLTSTENSQTVWVGLSQEEYMDWKWVNGDSLAETNWKYEPNRYDRSKKCASVTLKHPYWWYEGMCTESKPFICQFEEDTCRYQKEMASVMVAHNRLILINSSLSECYHVCNSSMQFSCRSFEYNLKNRTCQLSDVNRWTESHYFLQDIPGWDYYHRKCYYGIDDYPFTSTSTTEDYTTESTSQETIPSTQPTTTEASFDVLKRELEEIGDKIREKKRKASRTSVKDTRPSATSVGVVGIIIIVSMVGGIVILDLGTLHMHCKHFSGRRGKKGPKHRYIQKQEEDRSKPNMEGEDNAGGDTNEEGDKKTFSSEVNKVTLDKQNSESFRMKKSDVNEINGNHEKSKVNDLYHQGDTQL
ncbi:uncharacterized protein LOC133204222 [Saccostrea echinata]|uniref:uncharacterized protein LOC133204222 n=1 Tax=Saccostrea echinata TaxID=191078 RepID=UPI002A7F4D97|nr:uncharacterized protein LOC133204222 [Saccostrea echinata]